jgi:hypothetical protein
MKSLQERMNDMKPYFRGIEMYNEALIVRVVLPPKWRAYNSNDGRIKAAPSENVANEYYYYANSENTTYEDIFDLIEETIKANNDIVLKMKLLRDKGEELKELFSRLPYEELVTLKFVTEKPKEDKPKRKYTKKKKEAEKAQEQPQTDTEGIAPESIRVDKLED